MSIGNIRSLPGHDHSVPAVGFIRPGAPGAPLPGSLLVSASRDMTLPLWDVTAEYCVTTLQRHAAWVHDVAPSLDGHLVCSFPDDHVPCRWDLSSGETKSLFLGHQRVDLKVRAFTSE